MQKRTANGTGWKSNNKTIKLTGFALVFSLLLLGFVLTLVFALTCPVKVSNKEDPVVVGRVTVPTIKGAVGFAYWAEDENGLNKQFGRVFKVVSFRWINDEEVL